ncbi:SDR family oxidoreductase [Phenylobacterium sp.]|uniref:SDR family oxidoreductase n=1 Tax=Phenylobacterium sp. TaxID=1871053 RepID=UPI0027309691|nr:SDR family oxidoreductase [Phenylobacterium sp.]MDP1601421.1 SDR family oxidoreductase [Phenylobacterium sp.]MDP3594805.1 SDR family oxidoreductase [Phenylobacterium sp.]
MAVKLKPLAEQVIVITGASSGIGLATARKAAQAGAAVVLASRNEEVLRAVCKEINDAGGRAHPVSGDVGSPEDVEKIARAAIARFERFDTWINDAGVGLYGELMQTPTADHERLFRTNYFGVVNGSLEAVKHFRKRGGPGAIINLGSVLSDVATPMMGAYSASKHAVKGFTDALRIELAREKAAISVTLIKPSSISTPFADHARNLMDKAATVPPPHYAPEVVADAILYAAQHPTRDFEVGAGGRPFAIASAAAPGLSDRLLGAVIPPLSRRRGAKPLSDNLYEAGVDGQTEGAHLRGRRFSLYTEAQKHPGLTFSLGALAVTALAAFLARDIIGRNARPMIVRAVRPMLVRGATRHPLATATLAAKHPREAARLASALR